MADCPDCGAVNPPWTHFCKDNDPARRGEAQECPSVACVVCSKTVFTCEDCKKHPDGGQLRTGGWVCSGVCWEKAAQPTAQEAERAFKEWCEKSTKDPEHPFLAGYRRGRAEERAEWEKETQEDARIGQEMLDERAVKIDALEAKLAAAERERDLQVSLYDGMKSLAKANRDAAEAAEQRETRLREALREAKVCIANLALEIVAAGGLPSPTMERHEGIGARMNAALAGDDSCENDSKRS